MKVTKVRLLRHRQTKGAETDSSDLQNQEPSLYSTLFTLAFGVLKSGQPFDPKLALAK